MTVPRQRSFLLEGAGGAAHPIRVPRPLKPARSNRGACGSAARRFRSEPVSADLGTRARGTPPGRFRRGSGGHCGPDGRTVSRSVDSVTGVD